VANSQEWRWFEPVAQVAFFLKNGQTLVIRWREAILATEIQVIAPPRVIVRALPGHDVLLHQLHLVTTGQLRGNGEHGGISKAVKFAMNVIQLIKASKIK
jgi:hypothetical protein